MCLSLGLFVDYMENDRGLELQGPMNNKVTYSSMPRFCRNTLKTVGLGSRSSNWVAIFGFCWRPTMFIPMPFSRNQHRLSVNIGRLRESLKKSKASSRLKRYPNDTQNWLFVAPASDGRFWSVWMTLRKWELQRLDCWPVGHAAAEKCCVVPAIIILSRCTQPVCWLSLGTLWETNIVLDYWKTIGVLFIKSFHVKL